jgi:L-ascorbate metabolism protein UlaG (beta-lactamase superfamily)
MDKCHIFLLSILCAFIIVFVHNDPSYSRTGWNHPGEDSKEAASLLRQNLKPGEAVVWHLHHSGWAVKTQNHFLVFDYWRGRRTAPEYPSLANGFIDPAEIKDQNVLVFISHRHPDHYDFAVHEWEKAVPKMKIVFGWNASDKQNHINMDKEGERRTIGDAEIIPIHHRFDDIPEAAFLVKVDGLTIYHSGDHGSFHKDKFKENIDYLAEHVEGIDMAFLMTVDGGCRVPRWTEILIQGAFYTIETLKPKWTFPMHSGGCEHYYREFADKAAERSLNTRVLCAKKAGDVFLYK